jgi:hypothetical protein
MPRRSSVRQTNGGLLAVVGAARTCERAGVSALRDVARHERAATAPAVSAQVCLQLLKGADSVADVLVGFGVQDRNLKWTETTLTLTTSDSQQQCRTLTVAHPVMLTNHPHLVTVIEMEQFLPLPSDRLNVDGVTYTLQPTQKGDAAPES